MPLTSLGSLADVMHRITFRMEMCQDPVNSIMDAGSITVAYGLRMGVFGTRTIDDILEMESDVLRVDDEFLKEPIFVARRPKGASLDVSKPQTDRNWNDMLQDRLKWTGMPLADGECSQTRQALF